MRCASAASICAFKPASPRLKKSGGILRAMLTDGSAIEAEQILYATGRAPKTRELGLEKAGVELTCKRRGDCR